MGLLDFSYVRRPEKNSTPKTKVAARQGFGTARSRHYGAPGFCPSCIAGGPGLTQEDITNPQSTHDTLSQQALRLAHAEVIQTFREFWAYYETASQEEQDQIHSELRAFGLSMVPGIGDVMALHATLASERDSVEKGFAALTIILFALIPALGNAKKILRFWRWFKSVAKRGAKKAAKKAVKAWSREEIRGAFAAFAEEYVAQYVAVRSGLGEWDPADFGISALSGAASGAISRDIGPIANNWADLINAMATAFFKSSLPIESHPGGLMESLAASLPSVGKASIKSLWMGINNEIAKILMRKLGVPRSLHDDILTVVNVLVGKSVDILIDNLTS